MPSADQAPGAPSVRSPDEPAPATRPVRLSILIVLKSFEPGGGEMDAMRLAARLADMGADVRLAVGRDAGALRNRRPDVPCEILAGPGRRHLSRLELALRVAGLVAGLVPDVVICPGNYYSHVGVVLRLRRRTPKLVLKISNDLVRRDLPVPVRKLYHLWLRIQTPFYDSLVAMAPPAIDEIIAMMRPDPARVTMIHNPALDDDEPGRLLALRQATRRERLGRLYLGIGRLVAQKNFALLIDSFADIAGPDDRLVILGEGPKRPQLAALAARRGVASQIDMPGHCADIAPHLASADTLVLSSDYEGLGVVILEALAAGLPVVATDCSINMRWLIDGIGWCVPVGDRQALGQAMIAAARSPGIDSRLTTARAEAFTVGDSARQWLLHLLALTGKAQV